MRAPSFSSTHPREDLQRTVMAYTVMADFVMAHTVMRAPSPPIPGGSATYSYGLYSYGRIRYGLNSYAHSFSTHPREDLQRSSPKKTFFTRLPEYSGYLINSNGINDSSVGLVVVV